MTAAYRLKGVGWLIGAVVIALSFYLVSLRVADERKRLEAVNGRIAAAQRDIRALETEFDTRANLVQLERWNGDTLALAAPTAGQFLRDPAQLASLDATAAGGAVQTAALVVPAAVVAPVPAATSPGTGGAAAPEATPAAVHAAVVRTPLDPAARVPAAKAATPTLVAEKAMARLAAVSDVVAKARPQRVAMLDSKLLSDATLGDLLASARRESRQLR